MTFANGLHMSLLVARKLAETHRIRCRVLDLCWLAPLPLDDLLREANATGNVLVVDETRKSGSVGEEICAALVDAGYPGRLARVNTTTASSRSAVPPSRSCSPSRLSSTEPVAR